jgi:hypothetical protein
MRVQVDQAGHDHHRSNVDDRSGRLDGVPGRGAGDAAGCVDSDDAVRLIE